MMSVKVGEYSRSFHDDLILQDQASGERSQDQWSSGLCLYRPICVRPVWKPHCWFSHKVAHIVNTIDDTFQSAAVPSSKQLPTTADPQDS